MSAPILHLSIRVPWHDAGWSGHVCHDPKGNTACLILPRIRESRDDDAEAAVAGQSITDVATRQWPACMGERGTFMAPFPYTRSLRQPYSVFSNLHRHILPYDVTCPPYSALAIPFRWLNRDCAWQLAEYYELDVDQDREPQEPVWLQKNSWVQHHENQKVLLDTFFRAIEPQRSLCFFYAKQTPLAEDERRVIIGVGYVDSIGPLQEFDYDPPGEIRAYIWERTVCHSIRPDGINGFILPYHALVQKVQEDPTINTEEYVAFAPEYYTTQFSYGTEHVSHDAAIATLLACRDVLERLRPVVDAPCDAALSWIDARLNELWVMRGPYPGLGSVLTAFGVQHGTFLAYELATHLGENDDPWPLVDQVFNDPSSLPKSLQKDVFSLGATWKMYQHKKPERLALLKLLARLDLSPEQAERLFLPEQRKKAGIACTDQDILTNPYLLYEQDRFSPNPMSIWQVDRGVYPRPIIEEYHPLPEPSAMHGGLDPRRIRAMVIATLERATLDGHTLLPRDTIVQTVHNHPLDPPCPVHGDILETHETTFAPHIRIHTLDDIGQAYQLERFFTIGRLIKSTTERRLKGKRHKLSVPWRALLDQELGKKAAGDTNEERARTEKAAALAEIAAARIAVLIGPAGTGKTTLLKVLCHETAIHHGGVLLLAPTGKARVRMETTIDLPALTLAQFLFRHGRYDGDTGNYRVLSQSEKQVDAGKTVIVDEASMLTEEQLGALINTIQGYDRLILVGDPRQLPPIGAGRPFLDIVKRLTPDNIETTFPRIAPGYAELTVRRRYASEGQDDAMLYDVRFAEWFSGRPIPPGEDDIFAEVQQVDPSDRSQRIRLATWNNDNDLPALIKQVLNEELKLDEKAFEETLGGEEEKGFCYFHRGVAEAAEHWQILSPVRGNVPGVQEINRLIQRHYRSETLNWARNQKKKGYPKDQAAVTEPRGPEDIVYGDKVLNLSNHQREYVYPKENALQYIANGEIGIVVGEFKKKGQSGSPWRTQVAFSSQPNCSYSFSGKDLGEDAMYLQLAYAITIHKAQGSEFGLCLLVIPNPCRLLSRELLYTALTRQRERVVLLVQGEINDLRQYTSDERSEAARRLTNLFVTPVPIVVKDGKRERLLDEHLIHRSMRGEFMRSKSEVIIANALHAAGINYAYEQPLSDAQGHVRYPDFTIEDSDSGLTYYWEHCGMLEQETYRRRWEQKLTWYRSMHILPLEEGGGNNGTLIVTSDDTQSGFDSHQIQAIIQELVS